MIMLWLGGMRTAWTAVVTVSAIAKFFVYPFFSMAGIMIDPREETSATAEPEMPPKNMLSTQLIIASPPRIRPTKRLAKLTSRSAILPSLMIWPARMKNGIAISGIDSIPLTIRWAMIIRSILL